MEHILSKTLFLLLSLVVTSLTYADKELSGAKLGPIEINIGIYAPFSNKQAFIGRTMLGAVEMGRDALKSSRVHYSFYTLDQMPVTPHAKEVLEQFIATHHLHIVLTEGSANGRLAAQVAKKKNIIHFSMATDPKIADGTNNFLAWTPLDADTHEMTSEFINRFKAANLNYPAAAAGYTFDVFQILHQSILMAMQTHYPLSSHEIVSHIHMLAVGRGVMGSFSLDKNGVLYSKSEVKRMQHGGAMTA